MNIIKLNELEVQVESYNKNTYFDGTNITSNASCNIITDDVSDLNTFIQEEDINSIQIYHDNELIYNLSDITANISSINEYLNDDRMSISINLAFKSDI